jgi:hypothetical protein
LELLFCNHSPLQPPVPIRHVQRPALCM